MNKREIEREIEKCRKASKSYVLNELITEAGSLSLFIACTSAVLLQVGD